MATEIKIPIPDQTTEEVRIVDWKAKEGDTVKKGDVLLEIETDKSVMEVESAGEGTVLKRLVDVDEMVPVGQVIGYIGAAGEQIEPAGGGGAAASESAAGGSAAAQETSAGGGGQAAVETPTQPTPATEPQGRVKASPLARKTAASLGVELAGITGSGPGGRIVREDVEKLALEGKGTAGAGGGRQFFSPNARRLARELGIDLRQVKGSGPGGRIVGKDVKAAKEAGIAVAGAAAAAAKAKPVVGQRAEGQPQPGTQEALTKMRRAIGANLQQSFRDIPHFFVTMSIDMTRAMAVRAQLNEGKPKERRVSVNDLVVRACGLALKQYPAVNCRLKDDTVHYLSDVNIGIATAIEAGLVVPVLTNVDQRSWEELAMEAKNLVQQARKGKLLNVGKGTFTISNLGMFGVEEFTAIVNPPEAAILAVGGIKEEVVAVNGMIGVKPLMRVTLSSDHRLIDGALAAQFVAAIKLYMEEQIS